MTSYKKQVIDIAVNLPLVEADRDIYCHPRMIEKLCWQIENFPAFVLPSLQDPVIVCGIAHDLGVGEVWMLTGENFVNHWRRVLRQHRALCATAYRALGLHRMHMLVDPDRQGAGAYAGAVGFIAGNIEKRFGPNGTDLQFYVWPHSEGEA